MMAKMKYSEIPRDLSSDSVAAFRLTQGSPDGRDKWKREAAMDVNGPDSSSPVESPPPRLFQSTSRRSTSAFRSHCLGRKESPEPDGGSSYDLFVSSSRTALDRDHHRSRHAAPSSAHSHTLHHSLPRSVACKSSSLPANARTGLSSMLCVDTSALDRSNCSSPVVQSIVHVRISITFCEIVIVLTWCQR